MEKVKKVRLIGGIVLALFVLPTGYLVGKALLRPGPKQIEERKKKQKTDQERQAEIILSWEARTKELKKKIKELPPFEPPPDGIITRDQMRRYVKMSYYVFQIIKEDERRRPKGKINLGTALFYARKGVALGSMVEAEQMLAQGLSSEEHKWIREKIIKAVALAIKRAYDNCYGPEKPKIAQEALRQACIKGKYWIKKDNKKQFRPDFIDAYELPEAHYRYVLEYQKWLNFSRLDLEDVDMRCLLEKENIQPAPFTPVKAEYPGLL